MKKILNIADVRPSYYIGGLNAMVNQLVKSLALSGYKSDLLYFNGESENNGEYRFSGFIWLLFFLFRQNYDLAIVHSIYKPPYPIIIVILKLFGIKVYIQSHGSLSAHSFRKRSIKKVLFKPFTFIMLLLTDGFIFSNKSEFKNSIIKKESKVKFLPNLVQGGRSDKSQPEGNGKIIYLGKIDFYYKGIQYMLSEIHESRNKGSRIKLDIFGYGSDKSLSKEEMLKYDREIIRLEKFIRENELEETIKFHGCLSNVERDMVLSKYDALVLCSASEAMPLVISESLSLGVPVIITKSTNMGQYVEKYDCGFVLDKENKLSDSLLKFEALNRKDKVKMRVNAKKCFDENLDISLIESKVRELNF